MPPRRTVSGNVERQKNMKTCYELTTAELENGPLVDALRATGRDTSLTSFINEGHLWNKTTDELMEIIKESSPAPKITIDNAGYDIVARDEGGQVVARRKTYCNPAALAQIILDAEMIGEIDWENSQVAKPGVEEAE